MKVDNWIVLINKKIEHLLRTISFDCDEIKAVMPFEKELLDYVDNRELKLVVIVLK